MNKQEMQVKVKSLMEEWVALTKTLKHKNAELAIIFNKVKQCFEAYPEAAEHMPEIPELTENDAVVYMLQMVGLLLEVKTQDSPDIIKLKEIEALLLS